MSPSASTWIIGGGLVAITLGVIVVMVAVDIRSSRDDLPQPHPEGRAPSQSLRVVVQEFPTIEIHTAPPWPLSIDQAHATTQRHIACAVEDCPRKRAAVDTLIRSGRMKPACRTRKVMRQ